MLQTDGVEKPCITHLIWNEKYRHKSPDGFSLEHTKDDTHQRVVGGVYAQDPKQYIEGPRALKAMQAGLWCPGGRVHAGAGTNKRVTLMNCFVSGVIQDSLASESPGVGIMDSLRDAAITQQMGGGIGMDFSTLRPKGAVVKRTGSISEGPLVFMDMWDAMCSTIQSSGSRRGAMMGVLSVSHPDILNFIKAKREKGRLTNFNISVLVTDSFMKAVKNDDIWWLGHKSPPASYTGTEQDWYLYETVRAKDLWGEILHNTYEHAEPGIIFIDRINYENNLYYCEDINATNPCGEQPLPPYGTCNLGAVNLAKMVENPFTDNAYIDFNVLKDTVDIGMRFLDNVLDITIYPLEKQAEEARAKRRTGLGITGLANMLQQLKIRYGSNESMVIVREVMREIRDQAYRSSVNLSKERGPFGQFKKQMFLSNPFIQRLPQDIQQGIREYGIRNGVLLTIAPTGTTSIYYGNVSSGIEPTFSFTHYRKVRRQDGGFDEFEVEDYGYKTYREMVLGGGKPNGEGLPDYMVTALELSVDEHLKIQAVCQEYVDSSISKTINCPADMSFEDFGEVYTKAYEMGLKGCTTYRPSDVRGSVLSLESRNQDMVDSETRGEECPSCGQYSLIKIEGCDSCMSCGYGKCSI